MNAATLIEVNSETSVCECCGKMNLKRVAVLQLADGSIVRYGTDCAAKKLGQAIGKQIKQEIANQIQIDSAITLINKWQYQFTAERIANHINVKFCACSFNGGKFTINNKQYQPEAYSLTVGWWAA